MIGPSESKGASVAGRVRIEPVEEVTIGVSEPSNERTEGGGEEDKKKDIRHFLAEQWSLPSEKITIRMEGGDVSDNE